MPRDAENFTLKGWHVVSDNYPDAVWADITVKFYVNSIEDIDELAKSAIDALDAVSNVKVQSINYERDPEPWEV